MSQLKRDISNVPKVRKFLIFLYITPFFQVGQLLLKNWWESPWFAIVRIAGYKFRKNFVRSLILQSRMNPHKLVKIHRMPCIPKRGALFPFGLGQKIPEAPSMGFAPLP